MLRSLLFAGFFLLAPMLASAQDVEGLRDKYLSDPQTGEVVKEAIRKHVVVTGMCPFEAFAAAGLPGPYMVVRDEKRWPAHTPPPKIISAQCASPDESTIELKFRNSSQFGGPEPTVFRVRFVNGKSVLIDQKGFKED